MRILIILLFVSFNSFGQGIDPNPITYKNLMQIDSETQFKRDMIENGYEFVEERENETYVYARHPKKTKNRKSPRIGKKTRLDSPAWAWYHPNTNIFLFSFTKTLIDGSVNQSNTYDKIFSEVKRKCEFVKIEQTTTNMDFACYTCPDASFEGFLGFHSDRESGTIMRID